MKKKILFLLFLCSMGWLCAQPSLMPTVEPSPNSASLGMYGVVPVGHYTGTPQIGIPLYELELYGKTFPLSLSYHASGIRVAQEAGWVGLGWSLNAGGCITRSVRGWADFGPGLQDYDPPAYVNTDVTGPGMVDYLKYKNIAENKVDAEPDIFYFNFGGYSGSFFIPERKNNINGIRNIVVQKPDCYLDFEYINNGRGEWVIKDGDGFTYYFRVPEITGSRSKTYENQYVRNLYSGTSDTKITAVPIRDVQPEITSAWYLDAIVAPNGQRLTFTYATERIYTSLAMQETAFVPISGFNIGNHSFTSYSFSEISTVVLKKITGPNLVIDLTGTTRYDIQPHIGYPKPTCISEIAISNNQSLIKKYKLEYSYMGAQNDYDKCRLFLNAVQEVGSDGQNGGRHSFGYFAGTLPSKISTDIDHWGYYTKPATTLASRCWGTSVITDTQYSTLIPPKQGQGLPTCYGQNRNSDADRMRYGTLKSITYPTGGQSTFEYEPHTLVAGGIDEIKLPTMQTSRGSVNFDEAYNGYNTNDYRDDFPNGVKEGTPFEVTSSGTLTLSLGFSYWADEPSLLDAFWSQQKYIATLRKYNAATQRYDQVEQVDFPTVDESAPEKNVDISLTAGTYRVDVSRTFTFPMLTGKVVSFDILGYANHTLTQIASADPVGGGLCITKIESTDLNGNTIKKTYEYDDGTLMSPVIHHKVVHMSRVDPEKAPSTGYYLMGMSDSYVPMSSSAAGSMVGYSTVREYSYENNLFNGYTQYSFHNDYDEVIFTDHYVPGFPTTPRLSNGLITRKTDYSNQWKLVHEELYSYDMTNGPSAQGVKVYSPVLDNYSIYLKWYSIYSSWNRLKSKQTFEYNPDGILIWRKTESYTYEPTNYKLKQVDVEDSRSTNKMRKVFDYPENLKSAATTYQQMVAAHLVNPVVQERKYLVQGSTQSLLDTWRLTYGWYHGMLLPYILRQNTVKGSSTLEDRRVMTNYDKYGQPGGYVKGGLEKTVYLWAYNSLYPVAKIEGASYADVEGWLGNSFINSLADNVSTVESTLSTLRSQLSNRNVLVTTYTYRPQVGIQSVTAPNGEVTTYEYDSLGRLSKVKDHYGKVTGQYNYHFKP